MPDFPAIPPAIPVRHLKQTSLSFAQESLWFLQQLDPENISYNSNQLIKFTGGIDPACMEQALNWLVRRHEPLRTKYPNQGGRPVQVIQPFETFSLLCMDFSQLSDVEQEKAVLGFSTKQGDQPFNLENGPLTRFALLHTAPNIDYLFFCTHHIGSDAWSRQVFLSELMLLYSAFQTGKSPNLPELPVQYADYAAWQRDWLSGETLKTYIEHWKNILSGVLPILDLPTDRPRPILQTFRGASYHFQLSQALSSQMKGFCQKERMTLFQLLLAAYALLLMRHTGQEDIILGCPFANRSRSELEGVVGLFVNTLPIRVTLQGNPSVREFLKQVQSVMLEAYPWQAAPFEALVSEISPQRDLSRTPVFQAVINLRNVPKRQVIIEGLEMENVPRENVPRPFDISLELEAGEDGIVEASFEYNIDLFNEITITNMASHYKNLLGELLAKLELPLVDLEMLAPSELKQILVDWNDTSADFPQVCIQELISAQVEQQPQAQAVVCNGNSLTYGELDKKANQLVHYLRAQGVGSEDRVAIYLPRSEMVAVTQLAILKAGAAFVPLDLTYPAERIAYMLKDSNPFEIITISNLSSQLPDQIRKICLDSDSKYIEACETRKPDSITNNDSLAYVMYTSGSTGRPKGAMNAHKGIVNYMTHLTRLFLFGAADRVVQFTSLSFDPSIWTILGTLTYGGTVYLLDDDQMRDPDFIYSAIIDHQATYINTVPTMLKAICETALARGPRENALRLISAGGEVLRATDLELLHRAFGESVKLNNHYGPTECSISATHYLVPDVLPKDMQVVPIGKPISNVRNYILDNHLHPVPQGVKGELFIGGVGVGLGYWGQPALTAERFLPDPFQAGGRMYRTGDIARQLPDGTLCFLGRSDDQVKIRGYRIELSEIETVVSEYPGVKEAAMSLWRDDGQENLAAYITLLEDQQDQIQAGLRGYLEARLPFYMLPASITILKEMPVTASHKIDRRSLPRPESREQENGYLAPRNEVEARLISIWKEVIGNTRVGVRDNFFELGGDSLLAVRMFTRIQEEFGQSLPLLLMFKDGTVEALAETLTRQEKSALTNGVVPIQPKGDGVPLFIISANLYMRNFALAMGTARPVYGLHPIEDGQLVYRKSIQETVRIYYQRLVEFYPQGPYLLFGHSAHGYFALELARQLIKNGKKVALLGLLDTYPPGWKSQVASIDRIKLHFDNLQHKNISQVLQYARLSMVRFLTRRRRRAVKNEKILERYEEKGQVEEIRSILLTSYKPEPYQGSVVLFSGSDRPFYIRRDIMEKWANIFTGQYKVIPTSGSHTSMLQPPHVASLATNIEALLTQIDNL